MEMRKRRRFAAEHKGEAAERPAESGKILQAVGGELRGRPDRARTRRDGRLAAGMAEARVGTLPPTGQLSLDIPCRVLTLTGHLAASFLGGAEASARRPSRS
jgi:hypothetical protein